MFPLLQILDVMCIGFVSVVFGFVETATHYISIRKHCFLFFYSNLSHACFHPNSEPNTRWISLPFWNERSLMHFITRFDLLSEIAPLSWILKEKCITTVSCNTLSFTAHIRACMVAPILIHVLVVPPCQTFVCKCFLRNKISWAAASAAASNIYVLSSFLLFCFS